MQLYRHNQELWTTFGESFLNLAVKLAMSTVDPPCWVLMSPQPPSTLRTKSPKKLADVIPIDRGSKLTVTSSNNNQTSSRQTSPFLAAQAAQELFTQLAKTGNPTMAVITQTSLENIQRGETDPLLEWEALIRDPLLSGNILPSLRQIRTEAKNASQRPEALLSFFVKDLDPKAGAFTEGLIETLRAEPLTRPTSPDRSTLG